MHISGSRKLDPKLHRLVTSMPDSERLRRDLSRAVVAATKDVTPDEPVTPGLLTKRVLVRLTPDRIPDGMSDLKWIQIVEGIHSVAIPISRLGELAIQSEVEYVEAGRRLIPTLISSIPEIRADRVHNPPPPQAGLDGAGVVVGIIDFGLDFTLDDFRNPDGTTRIAFLWDQSLAPKAGEHSAARFGYGTEYDGPTINQAIASPDPFSIVRHEPNAGSHGTHVAGIAVGNGRSGDIDFPADRFVGTAPGATIIFVQPSPGDVETTFTDSVHVTEAIAYVFEKATELGMPCVVNMSLGQNGGSHDGESLVERAIDRLLEQPGRAMVVAAGNEHIWRGHSSGHLAPQERRSLKWKFGGQLPLPGGGTVSPGFGDFTPNETEVWYSSRDSLLVRITSPGGESTPVVGPGDTEVHQFSNGDVAFISSERFTNLNGDARIYIEISPPTQLARVASGVWEVELEADEIREGRFDAWIERDARDPNNRFADQSFFVGSDFDDVMTLGTPATTRRGIAVANYDHVTEAPNNSSSRGRTRDGRLKPEVAAPGTNILSSNAGGGRPVIQGGGQVQPMRVEKSGTSMSAPHVAGTVALMFQKSPRLTAAQVRKIVIAAATPPSGVQPFDVAWGFGKLNAEAAVSVIT